MNGAPCDRDIKSRVYRELQTLTSASVFGALIALHVRVVSTTKNWRKQNGKVGKEEQAKREEARKEGAVDGHQEVSAPTAGNPGGRQGGSAGIEGRLRQSVVIRN